MRFVVHISIVLMVIIALLVGEIIVGDVTSYTIVSQDMEETLVQKTGVIHPTVWLAIGVYMEARGEPYAGKLAVAYTKMNRITDPRWPNTIEDVIFQPHQFSWTEPGDPNRMKLDEISWDDPVFDECYKSAVSAYYTLQDDPSKGANHYLNRHILKILPSWYDSTKITAIIGNHEFLKL